MTLRTTVVNPSITGATTHSRHRRYSTSIHGRHRRCNTTTGCASRTAYTYITSRQQHENELNNVLPNKS